MLILTISGLLIECALLALVFLQDLRRHTLPFLVLYALAYLSYAAAVYWVLRRPGPRHVLPILVGFALLFRVTLLFTTPPTLSDDVYRYIWDGRVVNAGINPYAYAVDSPQLDPLDSPQRALVSFPWMASPYLPVAQALFALVYRIVPDSPLAFQVAALLFDLLAGWVIWRLLDRLNQPREWALLYLWSPLVIVEFSHGAHVDALMIALMIAALHLLVSDRPALSAVALAAATLTKGLPVLLLPIVLPRWRWRHGLLYVGVVAAACVPFALGAGWGLTGPTDGTGLFGALRIYAAYWTYNGSIFPLLAVVLSGRLTAAEISPEALGGGAFWAARAAMIVLLALVLTVVWRRARTCSDNLPLVRLAAIPPGAYLLLAAAVHPWYVTWLIPLLPFLVPAEGEPGQSGRLLLAGLYFAAAVPLSYAGYVSAGDAGPPWFILLPEYVPLYLLLLWAVWPASGGAGGPGRGWRSLRSRIRRRTG